MSTIGSPEGLLDLSKVSLADCIRNRHIVELTRLHHAQQILLILNLHDGHVLVLPSRQFDRLIASKQTTLFDLADHSFHGAVDDE